MTEERDSRRGGRGESRGSDRDLGLFQPITRRDLLHGVGVAAVGAVAAPLAARSAEAGIARESAPDDYPPVRSGLRGNHEGSFEVAHERAWQLGRWQT